MIHVDGQSSAAAIVFSVTVREIVYEYGSLCTLSVGLERNALILAKHSFGEKEHTFLVQTILQNLINLV